MSEDQWDQLAAWLLEFRPHPGCDLRIAVVSDQGPNSALACVVECRRRGWLHRFRYHRRWLRS